MISTLWMNKAACAHTLLPHIVAVSKGRMSWSGSNGSTHQISGKLWEQQLPFLCAYVVPATALHASHRLIGLIFRTTLWRQSSGWLYRWRNSNRFERSGTLWYSALGIAVMHYMDAAWPIEILKLLNSKSSLVPEASETMDGWLIWIIRYSGFKYWELQFSSSAYGSEARGLSQWADRSEFWAWKVGGQN